MQRTLDTRNNENVLLKPVNRKTFWVDVHLRSSLRRR